MGNVISEEDPQEDGAFFPDGFNLESPEANETMNVGTAAPNCQPKHTRTAAPEEGQEVGENGPLSPKHRRDSNGDNDDNPHKRQHVPDDPKKLSYLQMARLGYQELVNAIIRPPRADYKVRGDEMSV